MNNHKKSDQKVRVLVPVNDGFMGIIKGSAIVAINDGSGINRVYYEGNLYGAINMGDMSGRLQVAASRALTKSLTTSFIVLTDLILKKEFISVGEYQYDKNKLMISPPYQDIWHDWIEKYGQEDHLRYKKNSGIYAGGKMSGFNVSREH